MCKSAGVQESNGWTVVLLYASPAISARQVGQVRTICNRRVAHRSWKLGLCATSVST